MKKYQATFILGALAIGIAAPAMANPPAFSDGRSEHWGVITRNTIGSPVAALRDGPFGSFGVTGDAAEPPFGKGSLGLEVAAVPGSVEKVDFGNEVDFFGDSVSALNAVGFYVFQAGENTSPSDQPGGSPNNMPNIRLEIDPTGTGGYTTMVWVPDASPVTNRWSDYLDATTTGDWYFTGSFGNSLATCNQSSFCSFTIAKSKVPSGKVYSVAVGKGRDNGWAGAIDGLRLNNTIYDFEKWGVKRRDIHDHDHHH